MEFAVVSRQEFSVVGVEGEGLASEGMHWIPPLWREACRHYPDIAPSVAGACWGLMSAPERFLAPWNLRGRYLAGWEVRPRPAVGPGLAVWTVPAATYLTVECTMPSYAEAMELLLGRGLSEGGFVRDGAIHEFYPPAHRNPATDPLFLYCPVRRSAG